MRTRKGNQTFSIRLDEETSTFYRKGAQLKGITMSEHLRTLLVQGVISESVAEMDYRLGCMMSTIASSRQRGTGAWDRRFASAIFTCEHLLSAIVDARDPTELQRARTAVAQRMLECDEEDGMSAASDVDG